MIEAELSAGELRKRDEIFNRILARRISRFVGTEGLLSEAGRELEGRYDRWTGTRGSGAS
ncbi:MAG: hypothetical protein N3B10_14555 [Armatimonadetes bacterium]|nr:hypothetical protein [Armatimonadota bacterium]